MNTLIDKEKLLDRLAAFKKFNDWEKEQACSMGASEALAAIGSLYNLMPPEARNSSPDLRGIKAMQSALSHI
jgi:hypothetical protein